MTLYNALKPNRFDELPEFAITVLEGVFLDEGYHTLRKSSGLDRSGLDVQNNAGLFIPFSVRAVNGVTGQVQAFVPPETFELLEHKNSVWTVGVRDAGCFFVKGRMTAPGRLRQVPVFRVSSVYTRDFGNKTMHHWQVGGCAGS